MKACDENGKITIYECSICDCCHPWNWSGDCREDAARFFPDELAEKLGIDEDDIEIHSMDDRVAEDIGEDW